MVKKCIIIYWFSFLFLVAIGAQDSNETMSGFSPTTIFFSKDNSQLLAQVELNYGSGRNRLGAGIGYNRNYEIKIDERILKFNFIDTLGFSTRVSGLFSKMDFGLPGESWICKPQLKILYSYGDKNLFYNKYPMSTGIGRHNLSFGYNGYLTTDSTSQITGQLDYSYIKNKYAILINYENDTMLFYSQDKYRTAAFKVSYIRDFGKDIAGFSIGFNLWAGERYINLWEIYNGGNIQIPYEVNRGRTVTLYNGKEYAVDVIFASFIFNNLTLSLGYDSENVKKIIHNNIHYMLNDGNLPILDRKDKIYIEFKIGLMDDLF